MPSKQEGSPADEDFTLGFPTEWMEDPATMQAWVEERVATYDARSAAGPEADLISDPGVRAAFEDFNAQLPPSQD